MKSKTQLFNWLLVVLFFLFFASISLGAEEYSKPQFLRAEPYQIEIMEKSGKLELILYGKNFTVHKSNCMWNARETMLFVRHTGKGGGWQSIANNYRGTNWPNPPRTFGLYGCFSNDRIIVNLPKEIWCATEGKLEFKFSKGKFDPTRGFTVEVDSDVFRVPVVINGDDNPIIDHFQPDYFYVNQNAGYLRIFGKFRNGSSVLIDNKECKTHYSNLSEGLIEIELPSGFLSQQAMHMVTISDPQGNPGKAKALWVYGPAKVTKFKPQRLNTGMGKAEIKLNYGGLEPERVSAKVVPEVRMVSSRNTHVAERGNLSTSINRSKSYSSDNPPADWRSIPFSTPEKERMIISLTKKWMKWEGSLHIRLESKGGETEIKIPVIRSKVVQLKPPEKVINNKNIRLNVNKKLPIFKIKPKYAGEIRNVAKLMVQLKPEAEILVIMKSMYTRYRSETRGTSAQADKELITMLKKEAKKEVYKAEKNKDRDRAESARKHIKKLMKMIKEMMEISRKSFNASIRIN